MNVVAGIFETVGATPVSRAADGLARRAFTVADLEKMVEVGLVDPDERLELIGGEIVPMSPKGNRHEAIKGAINFAWGRACPDDFMFMPETGLTLSKTTYLEPDFIVFSRERPLAEIRGPDVLLAVEVADSSLDYDLRRKPLIYAEHGVRELWVVNAAARTVRVHIGPGPGGYAFAREYCASDRLEPTAAPRDFAFALDALTAV
jgi:Uma2 family endonuclease